MDDLGLHVRKMDLADGDLLVVTYPFKMSMEMHNRIHASFTEMVTKLGFDAKVLVLTDGADVKVVRKDPGGDIVDVVRKAVAEGLHAYEQERRRAGREG